MKILKKYLRNPYVLISITYILPIIFILLSARILYNNLFSSQLSLSSFYDRFSNMWDVKHYISIAEDWYVNNGDNRLLMVFFPFYPLCIRFIHIISGIPYMTCAFIISLLSSFGSCFIFYKLLCIDYKSTKALTITITYILFPFSFFIFTRMSEGLFMLLLFSTIYTYRKKNYLLSGVLGFCLSFTRLLGLAVGAFMLTELVIHIIKDFRLKEISIKKYIAPLITMFLTLCGFLLYLYINYQIHGNCFQFLEFQKENWFQTPTNPIYVMKVITSQMGSGYDWGFRIGVGLTNLISYILVLMAGIVSLINVRRSYGIYTIVYFLVCFSASWLLSGARYSIPVFTIPILLGSALNQIKWLKFIVYPLFILASVFFVSLYANGKMY